MSLFKFKQIGAAALALTAVSSYFCVTYAQDTQLGINVYLEGAAHGATTNPMRTDLWARDLLATNTNQQPAQTPCPSSVIAAQRIDVNAFTSGSEPVDWVCVELRNAANTSIISAQTPGVLLSDGRVVSNTNTAIVVNVDQSSQYHVVVHHKSHLSGVSDALNVTAGTPGLLSHDLTTQSTSITPFIGFGENVKQIAGENYLYAGDANQDVFIDGVDITFWDNGNGNFNVYRPHDVNLDGDITGADKLLIVPNLHTFHYIP